MTFANTRQNRKRPNAASFEVVRDVKITGHCDDCGHVGVLDAEAKRCQDRAFCALKRDDELGVFRVDAGSGASPTPARRSGSGGGRPASKDGIAIAANQIQRRLKGRQIAGAKAKARRDHATVIEDLMNGAERAWSYRLESDRLTGKIAAFKFQPLRLRLSFTRIGGKGSKSSWYTPDFLVIDSAGTLVLDEVKGHWEEAARVRIRAAADLFPMFMFRTITRRGRDFKVQEVKP